MIFKQQQKKTLLLYSRVAVINVWDYVEGTARHRGLENVWLCMYNKHKVVNTFVSPRLYP